MCGTPYHSPMGPVAILPVVTKDLPIPPRFTPYGFLSRCIAKLRTTHYGMLLRILGVWCKSPNKRILSRTKTPFSETNGKASKQPYARGGCCGRGRYSAWVTTGYPRGSCRESSRTRGNVGRGGRRNSGRTAWQMIFGYLASRGTEEPPHLTLGRGITRYTKGVVGLWPRG